MFVLENQLRQSLLCCEIKDETYLLFNITSYFEQTVLYRDSYILSHSHNPDFSIDCLYSKCHKIDISISMDSWCIRSHSFYCFHVMICCPIHLLPFIFDISTKAMFPVIFEKVKKNKIKIMIMR